MTRKAKTAVLRWAVAAFAVLLGLVSGVGTSLWQSGSANAGLGASTSVVDDYWISDFDIGSGNAGALLRARTARKGLYALKRSEAVYYSRSVDNSGRRLDASCTDSLSGNALPAAWWSITLYDEQQFLARNDDDAASVNSETLSASREGWAVAVGAKQPSAGAWLSTQGAGAFDLTLRLYEPTDAVTSGDIAVGFPSIERIHCEQ